MEFAQKHYSDYEVLIATHVDKLHLHSHFIINSVSFEHGRKLHQPPNTLKALRLTSDNLCKRYGLTTLKEYTHGKSKTMSRAEKRAQERGTSWKFELCLSIEKAMKKSKTKEEFISRMEQLGYGVKWTDTRKNITYTCPNGRAVRDDKLYGKKYLKENMEREFQIRHEKLHNSDIKSGWEYERKELYQTASLASTVLSSEVLYALKSFENAQNYDDELAQIASIAALTALSFAGVYLLIDRLNNLSKDNLSDNMLSVILEEIKLEPENTMEFEAEQEQQFTMTMGGY